MQYSRLFMVSRDAALALLLLMTAAAAILYTAFGFRASVLNGRSMEPTLSDGSFVVTRAGTSAAVGDVVKFNYNGIPTIHRVVGVTADGLIETKGDNPSLLEEARPVPRTAIDGRYVASLPPLGGMWKVIFRQPLAVVLVAAATLLALPLLKNVRRAPRSQILSDGG